MKRVLVIILSAMLLILFCSSNAEEGSLDTMDFRSMIRSRIIEILESWPIKDQYAVMFFIYPNECYEYNGYSNLPEFTVLYKCETDMSHNFNPLFGASGLDEERWNPAFWNYDIQQTVIGYEQANQMADALISWYNETGVENIGLEDNDSFFDSNMMYIGKGPNGLAELLQLVADISAELQKDGYIQSRFGRQIPIIIADFEFTWYMIKATQDANPNGEANEYIDACLRNGWANENQIK